MIRNSFWDGLHRLKIKYGISIRLLVNIAIRNVLIEEGIIIEEKMYKKYKIYVIIDMDIKDNINRSKNMEYNIGDIVRTKKKHPCGSKLWEITRVGVDFKLKCQGCGHVVVLEREKAKKAITKIEKEA